MSSLYLNRLSAADRDVLVGTLHASQKGDCFICQQPMDLAVHAKSLDVDHVEPLKLDGDDGPSNFALTHASCNRSKQASDLRVACVLATFERIRLQAQADGRGPDLSDVFSHFGSAKHELTFDATSQDFRYSFAELGDNTLRTTDLHTDALSGLQYFFARLPIAYLHHDDRINPVASAGAWEG